MSDLLNATLCQSSITPQEVLSMIKRQYFLYASSRISYLHLGNDTGDSLISNFTMTAREIVTDFCRQNDRVFNGKLLMEFLEALFKKANRYTKDTPLQSILDDYEAEYGC